MPEATVIGAGPAHHPESDRDLMRVTVDHPFAQGGVTYGSTDLWAERSMPEPQYGETISWDGHHVSYRGVTYRKVEYDSATNEPLH